MLPRVKNIQQDRTSTDRAPIKLPQTIKGGKRGSLAKVRPF